MNAEDKIAKSGEEVKLDGSNATTGATVVIKNDNTLYYDLETGETLTRGEQLEGKMGQIGEDEEDEYDGEDDDGEDGEDGEDDDAQGSANLDGNDKTSATASTT